MTGRDSLDAGYFEGIFAADADPWGLASSPYEAEKLARTRDALADRRYRKGFEVGCALGILTERLQPLCDALLAVDISEAALEHARARVGGRPGVTLARMAFPRETPSDDGYDLVVLSEVAYYWSDEDLARAAAWLTTATAPGGRLILVHYTGETDYPQTGDQAVETLRRELGPAFTVVHAERHDRYRLDLWAWA